MKVESLLFLLIGLSIAVLLVPTMGKAPFTETGSCRYRIYRAMLPAEKQCSVCVVHSESSDKFLRNMVEQGKMTITGVCKLLYPSLSSTEISAQDQTSREPVVDSREMQSRKRRASTSEAENRFVPDSKAKNRRGVLSP